MKINELEEADVLLFSAEKAGCMSRLIAELTGANVSHCALSYRKPNQLIHARVPVVTVDDAAKMFKGRTISVMRHRDPPGSLESVLKEAEEYLADGGEPFGVGNLILLAGVLLYQRITPTSFIQIALVQLLRTAIGMIHQSVSAVTRTRPVVCSQFVFGSYLRAGIDLELKQEEAVMGALALEPQPPRLIDRVASAGRFDNYRPLQPIAEEFAFGDGWVEKAEKLCCRLLDHFHADNGDSEMEEVSLSNEFTTAVSEFAITCQRAVGAESPAAMPRSGTGPTTDAGPALTAMAGENPLFVTPADLLKNTRHLHLVGTIQLD